MEGSILLLLTALLSCWVVVAVTTPTFQGSGPLFKVLVRPEFVYVGGRNYLYQLLRRDLSLVQKTDTGPVADDFGCAPEPAECPRPRHGTNNDAQVLLRVPSNGSEVLLVCGNVNQGLCRLHSAVNVNKKKDIGQPEAPVNYLGGRRSTVAFFAGHVLFAGAEYDGRPLKLARDTISARVLQLSEGKPFLEYASRGNSSVSALDLHRPRYKQNHLVRYVLGFGHGDFAYFVTTQMGETRVGRVCRADPTFFSYTELPVRCQRRDDPQDVYHYATVAYLGLEIETQLFIAFSTAERRRNSALCSFSLSSLEDSFADAARSCFLGETRSHLLEAFHGQKTPCIKDKLRSTGRLEDFLCDYGPNRYVEGSHMIGGRFRARVEESVTSLLVTRQWNTSVALLGTDTGNVLKLVLEPRGKHRLLYNVSLAEKDESDKAIRASNALSQDESIAYLLTGRQFVAFPFGACRPYENCSSCLTSNDPLQCGWCGDHCSSRPDCPTPALFSQQTCPPILHGVWPLVGPHEGGTLLTIDGQNLGSSHSGENGRLQVTVAGKICLVVSWNKRQITCKTSNITFGSLEGPIVVNVTDLSYESGGQFDMVGEVSWTHPFRYVKPRFASFLPTYGPWSGGTNVTITGVNLDVGSERKVLIGNQPCRIWSVDSQLLKCTTGPSNRTGDVVVRIDDSFLPAKYGARQFTYRPDPQVTSITPNTTVMSGGVVLFIGGTNLDSVEHPQLIVKVGLKFPLEELELVQECHHGEGFEDRIILCPTPALFNLTHRGLEPTGRAPVSATVDLLMDGAQPLSELSLQQRLRMTRILYYPDPTFFPFPPEGQKVFLDQKEIVLKGKDLNYATLKTDVVLDGRYNCNVIEFRDEELLCVLPQRYLSELVEDLQIDVKIKTGNLTFSLGHLLFVQRPEPPSTPTIAGVIASAVIVGLILIGVAIFCMRRRVYKKRKSKARYMVAFNAQAPAGANDNVYLGLSARLAAVMAASTSRTSEGEGACEMSDETKRLLEADNILITQDRLKLGQIIGQGHFGCVYKGELLMTNKSDNALVAVKTLHSDHLRDNRQDLESFLQEGLLMKDFHHHNVLTLIGVCLDPTPMVVLPYMMHGDLLTYVRDENNQPIVRDLMNFAAEIAEGMRYLAELKFIHRDLAARNCMLDEDMTVKVADFGLSKDVYEREYYRADNKKSKLPVKWMAPESLEKGTYSTKTDVWSYGVVLWELMTRGVTPYPDVDNWDILHFIKQGRRMLQPSYCPNPLYDLMLRCWNEDPNARPTFSQLVDSVHDILRKLEQKSKRKVVGIDVTYVNYPPPQQGGATAAPMAVAEEEA